MSFTFDDEFKDQQNFNFGNPLNINILKAKVMGNLLYIIAVILIVVWAIGFFAYSVGSVIHILLVIAIIAILLNLIQGRKVL